MLLIGWRRVPSGTSDHVMRSAGLEAIAFLVSLPLRALRAVTALVDRLLLAVDF